MPQAQEKHATITLDGVGPLPAVWGDRTHLIRLFRNLTENALQAVGENGRVEVETEVAGGERGSQVVVRVCDNGEGIAEEARERLFEPFFTTRTKGTGLGLAIARRTAEQLGGAIAFESSADKGTCFTVTLPTQPQHS